MLHEYYWCPFLDIWTLNSKDREIIAILCSYWILLENEPIFSDDLLKAFVCIWIDSWEKSSNSTLHCSKVLQAINLCSLKSREAWLHNHQLLLVEGLCVVNV